MSWKELFGIRKGCTGTPHGEGGAGDAQKYKALLENLLAAVIVRDPLRSITSCSPYTEVLTGHSLGEFVEQGRDAFIDIVHPDDREIYNRGMRVCEAGDPFQFRFRIMHAAGIEVWAETRVMPLYNSSDELDGTLSITFDVTGSVRYQRQIEERNRDIQDFTYMLSHDLRSPVVTIQGMLGVLNLEHQQQLNPDMREVLGHIQSACERLDQLVSGVLEYSKLTLHSFESGSVDLQALLERIAAEATPEIERIGGEIKIQDCAVVLQGDELLLFQVFHNLVSNAIKYRDSTRALRVEVATTQHKNPRLITVMVKDSGSGIPENRLQDIFQPFHRAHSPDIPGAGIGLATVKKLVEKLGGQIAVESKVGAGSCFMLELRLA